MIRQLGEPWDVTVTAMSLIWLRESSWNTRSGENACLLVLNWNIKQGVSPVTVSPFLQEYLVFSDVNSLKLIYW